jgi:hypothetical protein
MNITLRKANAIQNSIQETIRGIEIKTHIDINEFQDAAAELQTANNTLFANDTRRQRLLLALYNIRGLVGAANAQSGIDTKLATAAFVDKRVSQLEELAQTKPVTTLEVINGRLEKIRNRKDEGRGIYSRDESVSTSVIAEGQLNQIRAEIKNLKKQKQKINDEILELNIKTEIPLNEDVVDTLKVEGLI